MKTTIIDFEKKGNLVRFYLGDSSNNYYGDDWNDTPYEHNAGSVYDEFIEGYVDIAFNFDTVVLEPREDWHNYGNSNWCKDDMVERKVPCIIAINLVDKDDAWKYEDCFSLVIGNDKCLKFYFGDDIVSKINGDKESGFNCINYGSIVWKDL